MDFWDSYEKPKANKKTKHASKQLASGVNTKTNNTETANISINISLPKLSINKKVGKFFKDSRNRVKDLFLFTKSKLTKKVINISLVAVIVFSLVMIGVQLFSGNNSTEAVSATKDATKGQNKPDFKLIYPAGKAKETSYDANKKVASFNDELEGTKLTISQQSLPANFRYDPNAEVEKLAKQINANTKLDVAGLSAFMGQSIKGPQTVVFAKNGLLIFVKSETTVETRNWNDYVSSFN